MEFDWSDAWVLMAVAMCGDEGGDLSRIIGKGDMLNHAIFMLDELQNGFDRLMNAGFVAHEDGRYRLTEAASPMFEKMKRRSLGMFSQVDALYKLLKSMPYTPQQHETRVLISKEDFLNAVDKYYERWNKA
jgi:hypothetical protein